MPDDDLRAEYEAARRAAAHEPDAPPHPADNGDEQGGMDGFDGGGVIYFDKNRLLVQSLFMAITTTTPLAVHPSGELWLYDGGRYVKDRQRLAWLVAERLGDYYKPDHLRNLISYAEARLVSQGRTLTAGTASTLVNVANGMLDPFTATLLPHDAKHLSIVQFPVTFDPKASCPRFDKWMAATVPDRALRGALLEDAGTVLDLRGYRQKRALFLAGPTRSGKSTFARLLEAIVGPAHRSSEELVDLAANRFRAAELFGAVLNVASDIRNEHVTDVGMFKKLTGEDTISAERKFGHPFTFRFHGLFLFTMNDVPTVQDPSRAYFTRVRPYRLDQSFAGHEDPSIEKGMLEELPGILNRLVAGLQAIEQRGGYVTNPATETAARWFSQQSDRVAMFLAEATMPGGFTPRGRVHEAFTSWARDRRRGSMTRQALYAALEGAGLPVVTRTGTRGFTLTMLDDYDDDPLAHARGSAGSAPSAPDPALPVQKVQNTDTHAHARGDLVNRDRPLVELVVADMLVAAHDNAGRHITRRVAERLADDLLELLAVAGWQLVSENST